MKPATINHHHQYKENSVKNITTLDSFPKIKGYDFEKPFDISEFLKAYSSTGFQATELGKAIEIVKAMRREKATIFFSFTSNMATSGIRDIITYLVKHKMVDVIVTTAGGIEEYIIKCLKPVVVGDFAAKGEILFDEGVNRTGNIFVPNDRYLYFEKFINPFLDRLFQQCQKNGTVLTSNTLIRELGLEINNEESFLYWAAKNDIPVFCPGITDGSLGDLLYFFKNRQSAFLLDVTQDMQKMVNLTMNAEKTGCIILGGGIAKHYTLNAQIFREGCDYAVYINSASEFDGSDSGARPDEAVSWGKIKPNALSAKVVGDATILFPLLVAGVTNSEK